MSKRIFSAEQMKQLSKNVNVESRSQRSITYSKDFKIKAVKLYKEGLTSREIFSKAGFDLNAIGRDQPKECLSRWNKIWKEKGESGLSVETRGRLGRPKKPRDLSDKDKIKRLEMEIAYLKAENDFLAKLRAKRAE
jgi:transposase-like protein